MLGQILEAVMLICFGLSWPMNAYKSYKAKTAAGSSWQFLGLITLGYVAGIIAKFCSGNANWVLIVYFLNVACLIVNWVIYFCNRRLDKERIAALEKETEELKAIDRVLIATDGSRPSLDAIAYVNEIVDISSVEHMEVLTIAPDNSLTTMQRAQDANKRALEKVESLNAHAKSKIIVGEPVTEIVREADASDAHLVVMGSRGLSGLKKIILGSVSHGVCENVGCPVLIVK